MDSAFGKTGRIRERAQTCRNRFPVIPGGLGVKRKINQIGRRLLIVTNQITHQDVEHVIVDSDGLLKTRHGETMTNEGRRRKEILYL